MDMNMNATAERFKALRESHGWTQEQAAREFRCAVGTWARWERGELNPRPSILRMLEMMEARQ